MVFASHCMLAQINHIVKFQTEPHGMYFGGIPSYYYSAEPVKRDNKYCDTFFLLKRRDGAYRFYYRMYNLNGFYEFQNVSDSTFVLEDINGEIVTLYKNSQYPERRFGYPPESINYAVPGITRPHQYYVTEFQFDIIDIDEFLSHTYIRYCVYGIKKVDLTNPKKNFFKKFNKYLKLARKGVDREYDFAVNHKGDGHFWF